MGSVKPPASSPPAATRSPQARPAASAAPARAAPPAAPPEAATSYEIQKHTGGRWVLDSVADGKNVAIKMAKTLITSQHAPSAVQVMAVRQSGDGQFKEVRVFHTTLEEVQKAAAQARTAAQKAQTKAQIESQRQAAARSPRAQAPPPKRRDFSDAARGFPASLSRLGWRSWVGIGAVVAWCAIFYIWHQPQSKWAFDLPEAQHSAKQRINFP